MNRHRSNDEDRVPREEDPLSTQKPAAGGMFHPSDPTVAVATEFFSEEGVRRKVGHFHLVKSIGQGGMGVVYLAEQQEPIKRRVALKLISEDSCRTFSMDEAMVKLFRTEQQALALMNHPNIATVFEVGITDRQQHFIVMEFVEGESITDFCDNHRLGVRGRLELFMQVCEAIHHSHQQGVVHRDIKPNNVLVIENHGRPLVKVIDFGLAKAAHYASNMQQPLDPERQVAGTPYYMSPEQTDASDIEVDSRSDIYSLGVLLYELLLGSTPVEVATSTRPNDLSTIFERIRNAELLVPSELLDFDLERKRELARKHRVSPRKLMKTLAGDLDRILQKCLEKPRGLRYESADLLRKDIQCFLDAKPVSAHPPSLGYFAKKLWLRHTAAVTAALLSLLAVFICFGFVMSAWRASVKTLVQATDAKQALDTVYTELKATHSKLLQEQDSRQLELRRKEQLLYFANVQQAGQRVREGNIKDARKLLADCPEEYRGWEHLLLERSLDQSDQAFMVDESGVRTVTASTDGRRVLCLSRTGVVSVWNAASGHCVASSKEGMAEQLLPVSGRECVYADFAPSLSSVIIVASSGEMFFADDETFQLQCVVDAKELTHVRAASKWSHGTGLVCLGREGLELWEFTSDRQNPVQWKRAIELPSASEGDHSGVLHVSPNGTEAIVGEEQLVLVDLNSGALAPFSFASGSQSHPGILAFRPDGLRIAHAPSASSFGLMEAQHVLVHSAFPVLEQEPLKFLPSSYFQTTALQYSNDGRFLVCGTSNGQLHALNLASGQVEETWNGHEDRVTCIFYGRSEEEVWTGSIDGYIRRWTSVPARLERGQYGGSGTCGGIGGGLWIDSSESLILASNGYDSVEILDAVTLSTLEVASVERGAASFKKTSCPTWESFSIPAAWNSMEWVPDEVRETEFVRIIGGGTLVPLPRPVSRSAGVNPEDIDRSQSVAARSVLENGPLPEEQSSETQPKFSITEFKCAWLAERELFALISANGLLSVGRRGSDAPLWTERLKISSKCMSFIGDGQYLFVEAYGYAAVFESTTGRIVREFENVTAAALDPSNSRIAIADGLGRLTVWNAEPEIELYRELSGIRLIVTGLAFSNDGSQLITGSNDGTLRSWHIESAREMAVIHDEEEIFPFGTIIFDSEKGVVYSTEGCSAGIKLRRWGVPSDETLGDLLRQLSMPLSDPMPELHSEKVVSFLQRRPDIVESAIAELGSEYRSSDYRVLINAITNLATSGSWQEIQQLGIADEDLKILLSTTAQQDDVSPCDESRRVAATVALLRLFPEVSLADSFSGQTDSGEYLVVMEQLLIQGYDSEKLKREILSTEDGAVQNALLTLLSRTLDSQVLSDERVQSRILMLAESPDNLRRSSINYLEHSLRTSGGYEDFADKLSGKMSFAENSLGQGMAYFSYKKSDEGLKVVQRGMPQQIFRSYFPEAAETHWYGQAKISRSSFADSPQKKNGVDDPFGGSSPIGEGSPLDGLKVDDAPPAPAPEDVPAPPKPPTGVPGMAGGPAVKAKESKSNGITHLILSQTKVTRAEFALFRDSLAEQNDRPITGLALVDIADFCNWLSQREGLTPAYQRESTTAWQQAPEKEPVEFELEFMSLKPNANGYRLPTLDEWRNVISTLEGKDFNESFALTGAHSRTIHRVQSPLKLSNVFSRLPNLNGVFGAAGNCRELVHGRTHLRAIQFASPPSGAVSVDECSLPGFGRIPGGGFGGPTFVNIHCFLAVGSPFWTESNLDHDTTWCRPYYLPRPDVGFRVVREILVDSIGKEQSTPTSSDD